MPRPFSGFFVDFWDIAITHLCTKSEVSSSSRFADMSGYAKIYTDHVT